MSIFLTTPRYISVSEVKSSSTNTGLLALTDNEIQELIVKAEFEVDTYIGYRFDDFSTLQTIEQQEVKIATLYIIENLFTLGNSVNTLITGLVKSESTGDRSYTYTDSKGTSVVTMSMPNSAKSLLKKYICNFYSQII